MTSIIITITYRVDIVQLLVIMGVGYWDIVINITIISVGIQEEAAMTDPDIHLNLQGMAAIWI